MYKLVFVHILIIMEPNETVLSDIHIDMSHTVLVDNAVCVDHVKYAGKFLKLLILFSIFLFYLFKPTSLAVLCGIVIFVIII